MSGLSDSLVYAPKPRSVGGMKVRHNLPPVNGRTFSPGDTIEFSIPCGNRGEFMNTKQSYLKFNLKNTDTTNAMKLDFTASAVIRLLEVLYGSNVLEYVDQYGALYHTLYDAQSTATHINYGSTVTEGADASNAREGAAIAAGTSVTFCIPLLSGVLGTLQHKYLPVGDMVRNNLRLNLTLASQNDAQESATAACAWEVSDVEFVTEIVKLNSDVAMAISQANSAGYRIPMHTFSNHASSVEAGSKVINTLISGNYRSLKTLFTIFRLQSNANDGTKPSLSGRTNPFGDAGRWHYDVGGFLMPQKPVDTNTEAYMELQKAFHALGSLDHGTIGKTIWTASEGAYIVAQDLELQSHKSMLSENGVDVSTSTIYLKAEFSAALTAALRIDTFTHQDAVLFIDPSGMAQTVF